MMVTIEQRETFATDGVVKIPGAIDPDRLTAILELTDRQLADPGAWVTDTNPGHDRNRLFTTRYLWRDDHAMRSFVFDSGVASIAAQTMGSSSVRFYFDHLLVKEPETEAPTPWHQDIPYWPFLGEQICSVWVACTETSVAGSSLEFVRGSHRWGKYFAPKPFDGEPDWTADFDGEQPPDIEADRHAFDIVGFDVEPGDAIVFSSWILHGAPGNAGRDRRVAISTRWLGDDATWSPHPGCDPAVTQDDTIALPGTYPADDDRFPVGWAR
jgi:ectoine hydroxylase-related dioxygenase (phytanoyl-CoA dioxygenase family)